MLSVPKPEVSWPSQSGPQSGVPFMFMPNIHWLFLEFPKRASQVSTNQYVSCNHYERITSPHHPPPHPHPPASSSPIPRLLKPILSLHWCHLWANVLSVPVSPSSQGTWIALSSKQRWEISSLSPVQHCHPRWLSGKESTHQFRRRGFNLWVRKIPWRRKWQPTSYSCLENSMDRGAWQAIVHLVAKSWTQPSD